MGDGAAGGLWRHQQWLAAILLRIGNQVKTARNGDFFLCFT